LYVDTGQPSAGSDGALRLAAPNALGQTTSILIRNENSAFSTLQLDGSAGALVVTQTLIWDGRNNPVPAIENLNGSNTLAFAGVTFAIGGTSYSIQSDSNLLTVAGILPASLPNTSARSLVFLGTGDIAVPATIQNGAGGGMISVVKNGAGTLTLTGTNTFTGGTTINAGRLAASGTLASAVTVAAGATLAPNGLLNLNSALTNAGSLAIRLNKSGATLTNDFVRGISIFSINGTLSVTNVGTGIITAGDSFKIFSATNSTGAFAAISPATPGGGLKWNTGALASAGILSVSLGAVHPQMTQAFLSGTNLVFGGGGGAAGYIYSMLTSTNLATPFSGWSQAGTGNFDAAGNFTFTNAANPGSLENFYVIQVQ
jgi:autotransporter-associated beta strand protein